MTARITKTGTALAVIALWVAGAQATFAQDAANQPSLYDRLGGLAPIAVVVSDFLDALVPDAALNANPAVDAARHHVPAAYLKYHVTALVCQATGGPCQYHGRAMRDSHAHLAITEREWERMVTIFKEILAKSGVPAKETQELLDIVASTKSDIVVAAEGEA
jgi:hemoglobin